LRYDGVKQKVIQKTKQYLKRRNGAQVTPESSTRKSPCLLSKQLSATREDIANDHSSKDSELSPSQLSAFSSPVLADI
jgi:hypothetical protein